MGFDGSRTRPDTLGRQFILLALTAFLEQNLVFNKVPVYEGWDTSTGKATCVAMALVWGQEGEYSRAMAYIRLCARGVSIASCN